MLSLPGIPRADLASYFRTLALHVGPPSLCQCDGNSCPAEAHRAAGHVASFMPRLAPDSLNVRSFRSWPFWPSRQPSAESFRPSTGSSGALEQEPGKAQQLCLRLAICWLLARQLPKESPVVKPVPSSWCATGSRPGTWQRSGWTSGRCSARPREDWSREQPRRCLV